ncbi:MAG: GldG family protein [Chloroflexi bacterium]|nr:GldG family protein [Chloroflexota bacterium]
MTQDNTSPSQPPPTGLAQRLRGAFGNLALLFAAAGVVALLGAGILYLIAPDDLKTSILALVGIGLVFLLLFAFVASNQLISFARQRRTWYGANTFLLIAVFATIVGVINWFGNESSARYDATAGKQFDLSEQTRTVLRTLPEEIQAVAFFTPTDSQALKDRVTDLLQEYKRRSDRHFDYEVVDPEVQPSTARRFNVTAFPAVSFATRDRVVNLPLTVGSALRPPTEQDFTSMLLVVTSQKQKRVVFLTGHGERDPGDLGDNTVGLGLARQGLISDNYSVDVVKLDQQLQPTVPEDTAVLVIAGATRDLSPFEITAIDAYLKNGGRLVILAEPNPPDTFQALLNRWGVEVLPGMAVDTLSSLIGDPRSPVVESKSQFSDVSPITQPLAAALFTQAAGLQRNHSRERSYIQVQPLLATSALPFSWQETDPDVNSFDLRSDSPGPIALGMVVEATAPLDEPEGAIPLSQALGDPSKNVAKLVVIGDSDFLSNRFYTFRNNSDLFLNSVNWLAEDVNLISIRPKTIPFRLLIVNQREWNFIRFASWLLLPFAVVVVGGIVWWRRR